MLMAGVSRAQRHVVLEPPPSEEEETPESKKQVDKIIKSDHEQNKKDLEKMTKLVGEVNADLAKSSEYVISLADLKKLEEIEKLSKNVRDRMRRY
jgi:hypothetical protein